VIISRVTVTAALAETIAAQGFIPTSVTVSQGQEVMFNCSGTTVTWIYGDDKLFTSPDTFYDTNRNKHDIVGNWHLVIKDVQANSDAGTYKCDKRGSVDLLTADLVVLGNVPVKFLCANRRYIDN